MIDIIIPTYKNISGLQKTLQSIPQRDDICITVIDDCSEYTMKEYEPILNEFPYISFYLSGSNSGPGCVRNTGLACSTEPYVMFVDTGDYFLDGAFDRIFDDLTAVPTAVVYTWLYYDYHKRAKPLVDFTHNRVHGRIYKRQFLKDYGIYFCEESSYANEDIGFNQAIRRIIHDRGLLVFRSENPIMVWDYNENSLTEKDNHAFTYKNQQKGLALNIIHEVKILEKNHINLDLILDEVYYMMCIMQKNIIQVAIERPEYLQNAWDGAYLFYHQCFKHYYGMNDGIFENAKSEAISTIHKWILKKHYDKYTHVNFNRFFNELEKNQIVPDYYKQI